MAFRLGMQVRSGVIDNSVKGKVTGEIELAGFPFVLKLNLEGNARPDLAGCVFTFTNPDPHPVDDEELAHYLKENQVGQVGKMTAAEKREVMDLPFSLFDEEPKTKIANVPYLEWFSHENGRLIIEGFDYEQTVDLPRWRLEDSELAEQQELESAAKTMHLNFAIERFQEINEEIREEESFIDPDKGDEFSWELRLQSSDRRAEAYQELLEEADTPEEMEAIAKMAFQTEEDEESPGFEYSEEDDLPRENFVASQAVVEICDRIRTFSMSLTDLQKDGEYDEETQGDIYQLIVKTRTLADMCTEEDSGQEPGFLLAYLKREVARSQSLAVAFVNDELGLIEDLLWQIRDHLVLLAGYIRSE